MLVKQGHRVGTGMAHGRNVTEGSDEREKNEAAELLQQLSGTPRFGKRRLHLRASLTEKASETQDIFSEFLLEVKCEKEKITSRTREKLFSSA